MLDNKNDITKNDIAIKNDIIILLYYTNIL